MVVRPFVVSVSLLSLGFLGSTASAATGPAALPAVLTSDVDGLAAEASCFGIPATITGTPGADVLHGTPGPDVIAAGRGDDVVYGARDGDVICGGPGDDEIRGGRGFDSLDGGAGNDRVLGGRARVVNFPLIGGSGDDYISGRPEALNVFSYVAAPHGVRINLRAGTARGWGQDTLRNLTAGDGSAFDDVIVGGDGPNQGLFGGGGDDRINGGGGWFDFVVGESGDDVLRGGSGKADQVGYEFAPGPIMADLGAGTATGDGTDTLSGFEALFGSYEHDDSLIGDDRANGFHGYGGNDVIDGAGGRDLHTYSQAPGPVVADLAAGAGNDTLIRIEDLNGSVYDDQLAGDDFPNRFLGLEGDDVLRTRAGDDLLDGHEGTDLLDGGAGIDRCWNGETLVDCETSQPADPAERLRWREPRLLRILSGSPSGLLAAVASRD